MDHSPEECTNPNARALRGALEGLTARDIDGVLACLHDDVTIVLPYEPMLPDLDKPRIAKFMGNLFTLYRQFDIELTHIYELKDPDTLIARYEGDAIGATDGVGYANNYIAVFEFTDGLISNWREYDNPLISLASQRAHAEAAALGGEGG